MTASKPRSEKFERGLKTRREVLGADVRDAVGGAQHLHLGGEAVRGREGDGALRAGGGRPRGEERGEDRDETDEAWHAREGVGSKPAGMPGNERQRGIAAGR